MHDIHIGAAAIGGAAPHADGFCRLADRTHRFERTDGTGLRLGFPAIGAGALLRDGDEGEAGACEEQGGRGGLFRLPIWTMAG